MFLVERTRKKAKLIWKEEVLFEQQEICLTGYKTQTLPGIFLETYLLEAHEWEVKLPDTWILAIAMD